MAKDKLLSFAAAILLAGTFTLYAQAVKVLDKGDKCPEFNALDINGKRVSIRDFKGKYIYVDVWATWCGPCIGEIPFMKSLEEKFRGEEIVFVGISTEANRGKWATMVREKEMTGIQINTGGDKDFVNAFGVDGIPHFILIDKKGRLLENNTTRPSDPNTEKKLRKLLCRE